VLFLAHELGKTVREIGELSPQELALHAAYLKDPQTIESFKFPGEEKREKQALDKAGGLLQLWAKGSKKRPV